MFVCLYSQRVIIGFQGPLSAEGRARSTDMEVAVLAVRSQIADIIAARMKYFRCADICRP